MLPLSSPQWEQLDHAYGPATDIPALLRLIEANPRPTAAYDEEPWFSLWSSLCHQGSAYTASYAAVPHLVRIAVEAQGPIEFGFFSLPASIEIARATGLGPKVPEDLHLAYRRGLRDLHRAAAVHASDKWDESMAASIAAALCAAKGHHALAEAIFTLDAHIIDKLVSGEWPE